MSTGLKEMDKAELINLERLVHLLRGLSRAELETLEILLDEEASRTIIQSLRELQQNKQYKKFASSLQQKIQQEASGNLYLSNYP